MSALSSSVGQLAQGYNDYDKAMRAVNTMAGKNEKGFANLKDQVSDLAKTIPLAKDQLANGLYQVISNGVPEDNWISYLEASAKASVGGIADLGQTVTVTSTIIKNYGLSWAQACDIQDKIQLTAKNGVTSFEQLAGALPKVAGSAATLGISLESSGKPKTFEPENLSDYVKATT
jgi:TP901 family phage tail tape measure protein